MDGESQPEVDITSQNCGSRVLIQITEAPAGKPWPLPLIILSMVMPLPAGPTTWEVPPAAKLTMPVFMVGVYALSSCTFDMPPLRHHGTANPDKVCDTELSLTDVVT